jgi:hypothetical protein
VGWSCGATKIYAAYSLRRPLVLAILAIAARRRRAARRGRAASRPLRPCGAGSAVRSRTGATHPGASDLKPTNKSWRVDETMFACRPPVRHQPNRWPDTGGTIDFLLSTLRDADAAKRLFRKALSDHPRPRVINTDLAPIYGAGIRYKEGRDFAPPLPAWRTIQGYEAMNMIRKGQARWVGGTNVRPQVQFIQKLFELPA